MCLVHKYERIYASYDTASYFDKILLSAEAVVMPGAQTVEHIHADGNAIILYVVHGVF